MDKILRQLLGISWLLLSLYIGLALIENLRNINSQLGEAIYPILLLIWVGVIFFGRYLISKIYNYFFDLITNNNVKPSYQKTSTNATPMIKAVNIVASGFIIASSPAIAVIDNIDMPETGTVINAVNIIKKQKTMNVESLDVLFKEWQISK